MKQRLPTTNYQLPTPLSGLTLIEILLAISIGAIVIAIVVLVMNPGRQLASARDSQRKSHVNTIINAIRQNMADNRMGFVCASGGLPTSTAKRMASGVSSTTFDIAPCLVPIYIYTMPYDPSTSTAHYTSNTDYNTGYTVLLNATTSQVTIAAPAAETTVVTVMR